MHVLLFVKFMGPSQKDVIHPVVAEVNCGSVSIIAMQYQLHQRICYLELIWLFSMSCNRIIYKLQLLKLNKCSNHDESVSDKSVREIIILAQVKYYALKSN